MEESVDSKISTSEGSVLIQNYLETFNEEINNKSENNTIDEVLEENMEEEEDEGTYFVDQQGRYYYQATPDSQPVLATTVGDINGEEEEEITLTDENGQVLMADPDSYQTVTILPSESNGGEVSYVLIVQQPDDEACNLEPEGTGATDGEPGNEMAVYDFDETEEVDGEQEQNSDQEDDKSKILKLPIKKPPRTQRHKCSYCTYTSPRRYLLARHMKTHSEERPHLCSVCERGFKTLASLQNHVNTHTGVKPHLCKFCKSAFTTSGELVRHIRYRHTHEKPHKCRDCDYASVELSKLRRHVRCHTGERPYQCPHCTYASPDTFKLKRHLRTHTGEKPYVCDICNMAFTQSNSLKAHKLIHNIESKPVFQCELCPATCGRKTDLRIHIQKLHTSDKPLKCKRCRKHFPDRYSYKIHNKTHEGEKCFKCEICPYASTSQRHLSSHMLKHTDEKPFACPECDQSFRQKQLLRRHFNLYHNPSFKPPLPKEKTHECGECKRQFAHKGNLIRHMAVHDPESDVHERALALKIGRAKRIVSYMPDIGQKLSQECYEEEYEEYEGEEVCDETEVVAGDDEDGSTRVTDSSGQQYVVLEVIQMQGEGGEEQQVAIVTPGNMLTNSQDGDEVDISEMPRERGSNNSQPLNIKIEKDMDACFGFDEEEVEEEDEDTQEYTHQLDDSNKLVSVRLVSHQM